MTIILAQGDEIRQSAICLNIAPLERKVTIVEGGYLVRAQNFLEVYCFPEPNLRAKMKVITLIP